MTGKALHICPECGREQLRWFGPVSFDRDRMEVFHGSDRVRVTKTEWRVLSALVAARGGMVSYDQLHEKLYWDRYAGDDIPTGNTIVVVVVHLRRKLCPLGLRIGTVWGTGFYLEAADSPAVAGQALNSAPARERTAADADGKQT